ncbi:hypothetical protein [Acetobacter lambici]|nr:hypothetical protein [Acetobacter lambici]
MHKALSAGRDEGMQGTAGKEEEGMVAIVCCYGGSRKWKQGWMSA